jgi:hypothetical protein
VLALKRVSALTARFRERIIRLGPDMSFDPSPSALVECERPIGAAYADAADKELHPAPRSGEPSDGQPRP